MASNSAALSYSAALSGSNASSSTPKPPPPPVQQTQQQRPHPQDHRNGTPTTHTKRPPSPHYRPQSTPANEPVYVLTLLTDQPHHDRMTALRTHYFPRHLNKLDAHLTLFHALPASHLERSIIPVLQTVASETSPFELRTAKAFRLKQGVAIAVAKHCGVVQVEAVHGRLREAWGREGFLSEQDRGGCRVHYTVMNKVDEEGEVLRALEEVQRGFTSDVGRAEGLGLWRYDRGFWRWERGFAFTATRKEGEGEAGGEGTT
ncbi:hypothetical protein LTR36_006018 [Oleoguttula mirabilis]|uniref:Uncharacterized protein n=1 Tax=Oleoguttula mirabilis TaxID=1507867 RepID=A0AAV9JDY6_9PEZI|nr:hypothetical protein LTR36_006018 [Oleoguttula mirabilis]